MKKRLHRPWIFVAMASLLVSGCAPDITTMRPNHWKPSACVVIVDSPYGWDPNAFQSFSSNPDVVTQVIKTTEAKLPSTLQQVIQSAVNLCVVVDQTQPSTVVLGMAKQASSQRFEWVTSSAQTVSADNVRQLVVNPGVESYLLGWTASKLAESQNATAPVVGWMSNTLPSTPVSQIQSSLAGLYAGNNAVTLVPVNATMVSSVPSVVIAAGPLSLSDWNWVQSQHIQLVTLSQQPYFVKSVAMSGFPSPSDVSMDVQLFQSQSWKPGVQLIIPNTAIVTSNGASSALQTQVQALVLALQGGSMDTAHAWQSIPPSNQQALGIAAGIMNAPSTGTQG